MTSLLRTSLRLSRSFHTGRIACQQEQTVDIRSKLKAELKTAMKAKDTLSSTAIRSVLAEVFNVDKVSSAPVKDSAVYGLLRKSVARRTDAAAQYRAASRPDLAEKEEAEISLLQAFLPPPLSDADLDRHMAQAIAHVKEASSSSSSTATVPPQALIGKVLKEFWNRVPSGSVPGDIIAQKAKTMLAAAQ